MSLKYIPTCVWKAIAACLWMTALWIALFAIAIMLSKSIEVNIAEVKIKLDTIQASVQSGLIYTDEAIDQVQVKETENYEGSATSHPLQIENSKRPQDQLSQTLKILNKQKERLNQANTQLEQLKKNVDEIKN